MTSNLLRRSFLGSFVVGSPLFHGFVRHLDAKSSPINDQLIPLPHKPAKAKNIIFVFFSGGVSHIDSFDPKPALTRDHGKQVKLDHPEIKNRPGYEKIFLKKTTLPFSISNSAGMPVSSLFPHLARGMDRIALIRSMHTDHSNHYNATLGMHTGSFNQARPSLGSWVSYGLGTLNNNLPSFLVLAPQDPYAGTQLWASDFLPGRNQGTRVASMTSPIPDLTPRLPRDRQSAELALLSRRDRRHELSRAADPQLVARIKSFETAFGMQLEAPGAFDLSQETLATKSAYGFGTEPTNAFAWQCLQARRLVERGVRFVEIIHTGSSGNWDSHGDMKDHERLAKQVDKPLAALLDDLAQRGMLEDTLVVWTTEFGRTPFNNTADAPGREHHPWAFSSWLAGAGVKAGTIYGGTDEHGIRSVDQPVHVHDFHATILHLLGMDHTGLTYRHSGRDYRLTDVAGEVVKGVLG